MAKQLTYDQAAKSLDSATARYRARYLTGYALPDVVRRAVEAQSPETKLTRSGLEAKYEAPQYVDPKSDTYVAPEVRAALIGQEQNGARQYLSRVTDAASRLYDKETQSARFGIEDAQARLQPFLDEQKRQQDLADYAAKEQISARFRPGNTKPAPYTTLADARKDPLGFFLANYGDRRPDSSGGFAFFDAQGNPITVEQAAASVPGASRADFLADSTNPQDIVQKPDPNAGFRDDLAAGVAAVQNGAKKTQVRDRLLLQYPTLANQINAAIGL